MTAVLRVVGFLALVALLTAGLWALIVIWMLAIGFLISRSALTLLACLLTAGLCWLIIRAALAPTLRAIRDADPDPHKAPE
jgi:hypothetical protein